MTLIYSQRSHTHTHRKCTLMLTPSLDPCVRTHSILNKCLFSQADKPSQQLNLSEIVLLRPSHLSAAELHPRSNLKDYLKEGSTYFRFCFSNCICFDSVSESHLYETVMNVCLRFCGTAFCETTVGALHQCDVLRKM